VARIALIGSIFGPRGARAPWKLLSERRTRPATQL
jgi:hypothetical protein